jgi:hypothetical protein
MLPDLSLTAAFPGSPDPDQVESLRGTYAEYLARLAALAARLQSRDALEHAA